MNSFLIPETTEEDKREIENRIDKYFKECPSVEEEIDALIHKYRYFFKFSDKDISSIQKTLGPPNGDILQSFIPSQKMNSRKSFNRHNQHDLTGICALGDCCMIMCYWANGFKERRIDWLSASVMCNGCKYCLIKDRRTIPISKSLDDSNKKLNAKYIKTRFEKEVDFRQPKSFVYFISDGEFVKIGKANNPQNRISALQTGNPKQLSLLWTIPAHNDNCANTIESGLHRHLRDFKACGEWFAIRWSIDEASFNESFSPKFFNNLKGEPNAYRKTHGDEFLH